VSDRLWFQQAWLKWLDEEISEVVRDRCEKWLDKKNFTERFHADKMLAGRSATQVVKTKIWAKEQTICLRPLYEDLLRCL